MILLFAFYQKKNIKSVNLCSGKPIELWKQVNHWIKENNSNIKLNRGILPKRDHEPSSFWGNTDYLNSILSNNEK